jgi:molybdenum cofactor synthesis domain-containing protein
VAAVDRTAGIIIIGNEILSGKVIDTNSPFLTRELRSLGVSVRRILTIPDELDDIAAAVSDFHRTYDFVFTSGGVGPTHDDVTMEGVARGLARKVVRHPAIEGRIREFYKDKANEARLKMSEVPEGTELIVDGRLGFPTIKCENVYILPGIPEILEAKFQAIRDRFAASPYFLRVVYTSEGEGGIAEHLNATVAAFPELLLGSYPKIGDPEYAVKLTLESKDEAYVERALAHLLALLPADSVVRTE